MPATFILTTQDPELASQWARQLPVQPLAVGQGDALYRELLRPGARVWIRDIRHEDAQRQAHPDTVMILVGEPLSLPFEEAKVARANTYCLSYEESRTQIKRLAPMAAELAQSRAVLSAVQTRQRKTEATVPESTEPSTKTCEDLEFMIAAVDHLGDRSRVIEEFRRGTRARIRSSRINIFLSEGKNFVADDGVSSCPGGHTLVHWLQEHSAIVDQGIVDSIEDPVVETAIRQKLGEWNARLVVPLETDGSLDGWVAFGPRADGRPYSAADRDEALMLVRLLSRLLVQQRVVRWAMTQRQETAAIQKSGPKFRVIPVTQKQDEALPIEVREVLGLAFRDKTRVEREFGRLRVTAAPVAGTETCWVYWDEIDSTQAARDLKAEAQRHRILHDLGIMISHELANAMFSVNTYFQYLRRDEVAVEAGNPLADRVSFDLDRMKAMPQLLSTLFEMGKHPTAPLDMKTLIQSVAKELGGTANVPEAPFSIWGHEGHLRDALLWLCREIVDGRKGAAPSGREAKFTLTLQQRGQDPNMICLVTIAYPGLRLEQLKTGEPTTPDEYPTVPVYLAREVIRFHYGSVHVGQGIDGPELMISLRSRKVNALAELRFDERREGGSATPFVFKGSAGAGPADTLPATA